jgi:hypothetical protein
MKGSIIIIFQLISLILVILFTPPVIKFYAEEKLIDDEKAYIEKVVNTSLPLFDSMPVPKVEVWWNDIYFHYADCVAFCTERGTIVFSHSYVQRVGKRDLDNTIKHELTHSWVFWKGLHSNFAEGHNAAFIKKAQQLGIDLNSVFLRYPETKRLANIERASK